VKSVVAILSAACFLAMSMGSVTRAVAADTFETWPKKTTEPGVDSKQGTDNGAVMAGDAAGKKTATGLSAGTIGWIAVGVAAIIGIAIAAGSGGGGTTSNH
jgi:hypothetical protein